MTGNSILIIISILILILSAHILYKKIENQILHLSPPNWVLLEITFVFQIVNHFFKKYYQSSPPSSIIQSCQQLVSKMGLIKEIIIFHKR